MKIAVYCREDTAPHQTVAAYVKEGAAQAGELAWIFCKDDPQLQAEADTVVVFGIGGNAKEVWDANKGKNRILLDKPYVRGGKKGASRYHQVRIAINDFQPINYMHKFPRPADRWRALGVDVRMTRFTPGTRILLDGASNKYCLWNDLGDWQTWGQAMVDRIRQHTDTPIIYRPRPSHNEAPLVQNAELSQGPLADDFARARIVVSHGGNIGFDAVVAGIPHFAIGSSAARNVSETSWFKVGVPRGLSNARRQQWLNDLAYTQWTQQEFLEGHAWRYIRTVIEN